GRAARHLNGEVILYADQVTGSMKQMLDETNRRRNRQLEYNAANRITPTTIQKAVRESIEAMRQAEALVVQETGQTAQQHDVRQTLSELEEEMLVCAKSLQFERAAVLRDEISSLKEKYRIGDEPRHRKARRL
ncbi:MAG TPA: UvrB/UvrC motif-containing protein, partial [archaeon]|nr:UvrB/UvrC motif-containing protein [archaeon]